MSTPDPLVYCLVTPFATAAVTHVLNPGDTLSIPWPEITLTDDGKMVTQTNVLDRRSDGTMVRRRSGAYWRYAGRHGDDLLWVDADSSRCWSKPAATFWRAT